MPMVDAQLDEYIMKLMREYMGGYIGKAWGSDFKRLVAAKNKERRLVWSEKFTQRILNRLVAKGSLIRLGSHRTGWHYELPMNNED